MADATRRVSVRLSLDDAARVKQELREVGETGQRSLERIQGGADRASRALDLLDVAVRGVQIAGLAAGLRAVVMAGDALTQSMGRLNTALGSVERAGEIYDRLYRDSLQTGVAVRESVDAFARFSIAAREIGATSDQVATLVGGLQRIAIASGASQQEIASSTQQLAQALASGTLQGDELRSILEGLPTLAQALARELGVSIGELRKLGSEGKLTADTVFPALLRAVERLNGEFERAPLSVGRAFGQLTAAADQFLARLDQAIGLSNALARALSGAARVLDGVRRGSGLLLPSEQEADRRAQAEALRAQIARLEAENDGRDSLRSQPRRGSIQGGLVGAAQQQAGVDRAARLEELRRQYQELSEEITRGEQAAGERQRTEQEAAAGQAAEARRRRTAADAEELRKALDDRFRINSEYDDRVRRLREAEAAGGITAADRTRLETLALRERDEALRRIEGTTRRVASIPRPDREAEREINDVIRERERLIQNNENAQERYTRRLETLGRLVERSERIGQPIPDETISREANAALEELERSQQRVQQATERTSNTARELGLTFSSAFEDAIIKGESFSKVLQGILQDIARIVVRRTITEPLGTAVTSSLAGFDFGSIFSGIGSALGGLFRAEGGPVAGGQPYIVGERGPEWFVPNRSGTVLPNGMAPGGPVINQSITIDARGADAGVEARLRVLSAQIVRQASAATLDASAAAAAPPRSCGDRAMTEYAWPATLRPSRLSFYLQHNTLRFVSPVTRATQVLRREGARWVAEASFEPLGRVQAGVMDGLLAALAGSANTVRIWDWRREYRTGDPRSQGDVPTGPYSFSDATIFTDGTGLVVGWGNPSLAAGAPRGALSIVTQGWWPSTVAVGAGDYIGLGGRLYIATAAVAASGAGTATIAIAPPLRAAVVVGEPLILSLPSVPMRLASDDEAANPTRPGPFAAVTIRLEEAL